MKKSLRVNQKNERKIKRQADKIIKEISELT